jgi:hypothetical protein
VEAAFLYSEIDYDIYVELLSDFGDSSKHICILLKLLYDLKQAPRIWSEILTKVFQNMELNPLTTDSSIFYKDRKNTVKSVLYIGPELIISVHINDFLTVDQISVLEEFKIKIAAQFVVKYLNMASNYLGIQINRLESLGAIKLH